MKKIKVILIGAGCRGIEYTDIMSNTPEKYEIVAVAEPIENRRNYIKEKHNLSEDMCFNDWRPLLEKGRIADIAVIAMTKAKTSAVKFVLLLNKWEFIPKAHITKKAPVRMKSISDIPTLFLPPTML